MSQTQQPKKETRGNGWSSDQREIYLLVVASGRRGIFPVFRVSLMPNQVMPMEKGIPPGMWISPSNRPCWNSSYHLQCQAGSERIAPTLFLIIDPNVEESSWNDQGTQYRTGVYYKLQEDLPTIDQVFWRGAKNTTKPLAGKKRSWAILSRRKTTT